MNDQNQNTCMACSCPCEMHKEHNHPTEQAGGQQGYSMACSRCGLKAKSTQDLEVHEQQHGMGS